jgi:hypothetical protein
MRVGSSKIEVQCGCAAQETSSQPNVRRKYSQETNLINVYKTYIHPEEMGNWKIKKEIRRIEMILGKSDVGTF